MLKPYVYMRLVLLGLLLLNSLHLINTAWAAKYDRSNRVDRLIVKYKQPSDENPKTSLQRANLQQGQRKLRRSKYKTGNRADIYYLDQPQSTAEARRIARELMQNPDVEYAEPDYRRYPAFVPDDTGYVQQWYLSRSTLEPGAINAQQGWDVTRGDSSVIIAVIDTGILSHEDIGSARILPGHDFISDAPAANDGNGRDTDPTDEGDFITNAESSTNGGPFEDCEVSNSSWHGTLVSGVLIAATDNAQGIAGLDHNAFLLPLRALGKCGGSSFDVADAIRWAAGLPVPGTPLNENPADVINLSLGSEDPCSITEQEAINEAVAVGAVIVAAAGNEGQSGIDAPASCDHVIAVAASTRQGGETCYTNVGTKVDLSAPGGNGNETDNGCNGTQADGIRTTDNTGTSTAGSSSYSFVTGTSFSTPMVAGTAALMRAVDSSLTPTSIELYLKNTARDFPDGTNDGFRDCTSARCGSGILDVFGAVTAAGQGGLDSVPNPFRFEDRRDVDLSTVIVSKGVKITGIDTPAAISISGHGEYSIDGDSFTKADSTINANQTVRVRLTSSAGYSAGVTATLDVGGISDIFSATTRKRPGGGGEAAWLLPLCIGWYASRRFTSSAR